MWEFSTQLAILKVTIQGTQVIASTPKGNCPVGNYVPDISCT
jgi:hypothetical protein